MTVGCLGAVLVTAAGLAGHELLNGESWSVLHQEVEGNQHASDLEIRHLANIRLGTHLFSPNLSQTVRGIERHPWIRTATARRTFPSTITIQVEEYEPFLLLALDKLWYVSEDGIVFKRADSGDLDYPVLTGIPPELARESPEVAQIIIAGALRILQASEDHATVGTSELSELLFQSRIGYTLILRNGSELIFGFESPTHPLGRLNQMLAAGLDLGAPKRINLNSQSVAIATPLGDPT